MQRKPMRHQRQVAGLISMVKLIPFGKYGKTPVTIAGLSLTAIVVGALLPSGQKAAQSRPTDKTPAKAAASNVKSAVAATPVAATSGRRSIDFYTRDVRAGMFSEPVAPAPPTAAVEAVKPVPPAPVDPFADYSFTGTAQIGNDRIAIVENINTHEGYLLRVGQDFPALPGTRVSDIDEKFLTFNGAAPKTLMLSMITSPIPLTASAGFITQKAQDQNMVQAKLQMNLTAASLQAAGAPGGPSLTLPNGTVLSGRQLQRYQNRLNRGWQGGGSGGMGGGGRGGGGGYTPGG